ncbi:MAG: tetratricopeptide repeat protein [Rhizobacter sp.]
MNLHHPLRTAALCATLTLLVACSSKVERVQSGLVKGADYVRLADWDKANVEVRNVLQIDPKNAQAYFISAQIAEGKRDLQRAFASYSKALELKPDHIDAKVGLARVYLFAGEVDKSSQAVNEAMTADPRHVGARTMQAALLSRQGKVPEAIALAQTLINEQKNAPVETSMLLAGLYASQGNSAAALGVVENALKIDPKNLSLLQVAAQIAGAANDTAIQSRAVGFFRQATELAPKNNDLWSAWAVHHTRRNELDLAEQVLRASIKAQPDESQRTLALLDFLAAGRGKDVAEKEFLAAISAKPKDTTLRFGLVNLYRASDRAADARRVLQEIIDLGKDAPSGLAARNQLAADRLANGKVAEARQLIGEVLAASPRDGAALVMHGRMLLADGDARNAIIDLRSAAKDQPGSPEVVGLLAQAHRKSGEPQLAREVLADAVKFKPDNAELRLLLAADMADARDYKAAAAEIDSAIKAAPVNLRAYDMKAQLALVQKDSAAAEKTYAALKTQFPQDPAGWLKLGKLYSDQKKFDAALKEYDEASRMAPGAPVPMLSAIGILIAQRRFDEANTRIDALMKSEPKNVLPYQLRGEVAAARNDLPLAEQAYRKMIEFAPTIPAGYVSLARVKALRNNVGEAIAVLEEGEKAIPNEVSLPATRAEWLSRAGRTDDAIALYEALVKRLPDEDSYANNLAYLLMESKGDQAHLERALSLTRRFKESNNAGYLDSLGWAHYRLGQYAEAVPVLERAVQRSPEAPLLQLHLGMALHKSGDATRAQEFLKKAIASKVPLPNLDEARVMVAQR